MTDDLTSEVDIDRLLNGFDRSRLDSAMFAANMELLAAALATRPEGMDRYEAAERVLAALIVNYKLTAERMKAHGVV